jgi:chemotaxis protein histidine kinase CheA
MIKKSEKKPETIQHKDHSVIIPPTTLRDRAMSIGGGSKDGFDTSALERAEQALQELEVDFSNWMRDEAIKLEAARDTFRSGPEEEDKQQVLYRASHDIRGQGKTFGYPLAAELADGLCDLIDGVDDVDSKIVDLVDAHIDAIRAVVRDDVRNDQDRIARSLIEELRGAREAIIGVNRFVKINAEVY